VHPAVQEDGQVSTRALGDIRNKSGPCLGVSAVEPTERFDRNRAAILEIADGDQMSLVHGRSCLLMLAAMADYG